MVAANQRIYFDKVFIGCYYIIVLAVLISFHGMLALQKMKYEFHTKLPQIAYQIQIWYAIFGNLV